MSETALARTDGEDSGYLVLQRDVENIMETMQANLGPLNQLSPFDLQRISIPTSGGISWNVPTLKGPESTEELPCIICAWHPCRGFWPGAFSGSEPPQCASPDGITGKGEPGGLCAECEYNEWGTATDDKGEPTRGKACKEMRRLFVLLPNTMIPYVLTLPPTSLKQFTQYLVALSGAGLDYWAVETVITLATDKNNNGVSFSQCQFELSRELKGEEREAAELYANQFKSLTKNPEPPTAEEHPAEE